jgi:hypothetical protein
MSRRAPDALLLDAAKVVELAEAVDQKKRDRLLFRLAREVLRADETIAHMGYQIMMLENHLLSARASAQHWEGVAHTLQPQSQAKDDAGSQVSHTSVTYPLQTVDGIVAEFRGKSVHGLSIRLADHARFLEAHCEHWKRLYECAQNANAFRQAALGEAPTSASCTTATNGE